MRSAHRFSGFRTLLATSLVAVAILLGSSAVAQSGHPAHLANVANTTKPNNEMKFEVVSIRPSKPGTNWSQGPGLLPNGYRNRGLNMWMIIMTAYAPDPNWGKTEKVLNAPGWVVQDLYDIDARVAPEDFGAWQKQNQFDPVLLRSALQAALKERCHLSLHAVPTQIPYLDLVVGKQGLKIKQMSPGTSIPARAWTLPDGGRMALEMREGKVDKHYYGVTMREFALSLTEGSPERPVRDKTGLTGRYEFTLRWQDNTGNESLGALGVWPIDSLGLAYKSGTGPATNLVVDHIDKPDAN